MSYLDLPRMVFAGRFQADPSTVNNDPHHFDAATFRSNYQLPGPGMSDGWWNPQGTGAWRLFDCSVRAVYYRDGTSCDDPNIDPTVGLSVSGSRSRAEAKLVDLDPEQQMVSEIWGLQILLGGAGAALAFSSDFDVTPFSDIWTRYPQGQPDSFFGAVYQSTLSGVDWNAAFLNESTSRFLRELATGAGSTPRELSIKFNVDGFDDDASSTSFTFGRIVGSIGLYESGTPRRFTLGRRLNPPVSNAPLNYGVARLDGNRLAVDLGNSLPTASAGGPLVDLGILHAALLPPDDKPVTLGEVPYQCAGWYENTAGIHSFTLTDAQAKQATETPIGIVQSVAGAPLTPVVAERPDGSYVRADQFVFRLDARETQSATLWATKFGRPLQRQQISLTFDNSYVEGQVSQGPVPGPAAGTPASGLHFPATVTTGDNGSAEMALTGNLDGRPRKYIDGQVYGVSCQIGSVPAKPGQNPLSDDISVLVWSPYQVPDNPTWLDDVQPIFRQYADLYPVMRPIVELDNYASVVSRLQIMRQVFDAPVSDPNYMPVTRDLSGPMREMLRTWLREPRYMRCDSKESLLRALQLAIELEHATLPPYLTALYSIKPGANVEVAALIRSIVLEEMLHMSLVCNLMVAIGGSPAIDKPGFVPNYPGSLPGGLRAGLTVRLRRCSIEQIRDVFLSIEEPEETAEPDRGTASPNDLTERHPYTIGWFYDEVRTALKELAGDGTIQFGHLDRQVKARIGTHDLFKIESLEDALRAIAEIKEQGEGASPLNPDESKDRRRLAHFYKFSEIVHGRRIEPAADGHGFGYTGDKVPFDPDGVYPMMDDPNIAKLPPASRAHILSQQFNASYLALLNGLHETFNGSPANLANAVGSMYSLEVQARALMQTSSGLDDGTTAGISFQLPFPL
ncbi:MAG: ferritin-like domain-containing protein [Vicinamibacteraceae bacterium]